MADDALHLGGRQDVSRITLTVGEISVLDIFDQNSYAGDPKSQFLNWALVGNEAWDYPADSLGYITGFAAELNEPNGRPATDFSRCRASPMAWPSTNNIWSMGDGD